MPKSKPDTSATSPDLDDPYRLIGSDFAKVDAYENGPADYAEIPELDGTWFKKATLEVAGKPVRRGRPPTGLPRKQQVSLRLSPEVLSHFRATGPGWQGRIEAALKRAIAEEREPAKGDQAVDQAAD